MKVTNYSLTVRSSGQMKITNDDQLSRGALINVFYHFVRLLATLQKKFTDFHDSKNSENKPHKSKAKRLQKPHYLIW